MLNSLSPRAKGLLAASTTAICWSFLAIVIKVALKYADSYSIVWYRMITATVIMSLFLFFKDKKKSFKVLSQKPGILLIAALCLAANYIGYMKGVELTSPANAQIFIQLGPLLLALAGVVLFHEKLTPLQILGLVVCVGGFSLFFTDKFSQSIGTSQNYMTGQIWVFAAALTWAIFAVLQKSLLKVWHPNQINLYIYVTSSIVFLPTVDWQTLADASLLSHLLFIFLGFNTLLAYGSLSIALKYLPATQVSPIIILNPLLTILFVTILDATQWNIIPPDPISASGYIGAILAVSGVILVVTQKKSLRPARR